MEEIANYSWKKGLHVFLLGLLVFYMFNHVFGHKSDKNAYKIDLFRPRILKQFLYKPK